jgi:hypothetical protein
VAELLSDLDGFRRRVRRVNNRALFEVPHILDRILKQADAPGVSLPAERRPTPTPWG